MAKRRSSRGRPCPERIALDHAVRRWQAECENAQRLSSRENGLLTVLAAILGLGFFQLKDFTALPPWWNGGIKALLALAVGLVLLALYRTILVARKRHPDDDAEMYASAHLRWPSKPDLHPSRLKTEEEAVRVAFARTAKAAASLHRRNVRRRSAVDQGQGFLVLAIGLAAVAFVARMFCPEPAHKCGVSGPTIPTQDTLVPGPSEVDGEAR